MYSETPVKVILHGSLKDLHPGEITLLGHTPAEVFKGLQALIPELNPRASGEPNKIVQIVGHETREALFSPLKTNELHVVPAMTGGKAGGLLNVVLGAVMIAAAFWNPALFASAGMFSAASVMRFGISLVLGGLLNMLSPAPSLSGAGNARDPEQSKYLGAGENTVKIGTRIPLLYGRHKAFGHYISYNIDAVDVDVVTGAEI